MSIGRRLTWAIFSLLFLVALGVTLGLTSNDASAGSAGPGDANCDGRVNSIDASVILQYGAGLSSTLACQSKADTNGDGRVNSLDAALILQYSAGLLDHIGPAATATPTRTRTPMPPSATPTHTSLPPAATPTFTPPTAPTETPSGDCALQFASFYTEPEEFCANSIAVQLVDTIPGSGFFEPVSAPAGASFAIVSMAVRNFGVVPDDVGTASFRLRDNQGRAFDMDFHEWITAQLTAEDYYGGTGAYVTIQPGLSKDGLFVFLVPSNASGLSAERCPSDGCDAELPGAPSPPCSLALPSFYSEPATFCASGISNERITTLPASLLFDPVTAPPGEEFVLVSMKISNFGYAPAWAGASSIRLRDAQQRIFTMDFDHFLEAQFAAETYLGLKGAYQTIQPGLSLNMVFTFLVPSGATGLTVEPCPLTGCT